MKVAIVYDRVNKWGGAERVLLTLHEIFPNAPLYTSVYDKKNAKWARVFPKIVTSFLQKFPLAKSNHEFLAPLMPLAFESFDLSEFDAVISVTSEAAKGVKTREGTLHVCYCLTPTRYLWSGYNDYFKNRILKNMTKPLVSYLRKWDKKAAKKPDIMIGISTAVQKRIKKYYRRPSEILFPPVEIKRRKSKKENKNYYLIVSRLDFGYKKVELAIETFNKLGYPLLVIGSGREAKKLKSLANKNIKFKGSVTDKSLNGYYAGATALIMPQEEDFGIVAVEAQAHGVPVIAYGKGGAQDTVIHGKTGVLFTNQTVKSLTAAIAKFEKMSFKVDTLYKNARKFHKTVFKRRILALISKYNRI